MGINYETLAAANKYTEDTIIGQGAIKGDKGDPGPKGDPGEGIAAGGTTGQVLIKSSNADYDTEWGDAIGPNTVLAPKTTSEGTYKQAYYPEHVTITPQQDGSINCETDGVTWTGPTFSIDVSLDMPTKIEFTVTALDDSTLPSAFLSYIRENGSSGSFRNTGSMSIINGNIYIILPKAKQESWGATGSVEFAITTNQAIKFNLSKPTVSYGNTKTLYDSLYSPLSGKKAIFLGDSITALTGSRGWVNNFCALTGCENVANVAVPGAVLNDYEDTVYDGNPSQSVSHNNTLGNQVQKIINNAYEVSDLIIIAIGTNGGITADSTRIEACYDATNSGGTWSLPDITNIDRTHSEGAFRYCNEKLHSLYPNAIICWCNPIQRAAGSAFTARSQAEWCNNLKTLTNFGGVLNIETNRCGIMTANEIFGVNGEDLADGLHPNSNGAMKMARYNAAAISKLFV